MPTPKTQDERKQEIITAMQAELVLHEIDDTLSNRFMFLKGLADAWLEDDTVSIGDFPEYILYLQALQELLRELLAEYQALAAQI